MFKHINAGTYARTHARTHAHTHTHTHTPQSGNTLLTRDSSDSRPIGAFLINNHVGDVRSQNPAHSRAEGASSDAGVSDNGGEDLGGKDAESSEGSSDPKLAHHGQGHPGPLQSCKATTHDEARHCP